MRHHRMHTTAVILALLSAAIFTAPAVGSDGPGSAGAGYLLRPVGPKSIAMGEVKAALDGDPFGWLSNPSALSRMERSGLGVFHSEWLIDTRFSSLAGNVRLSEWFTLGGGLVYEFGEDIPGFDSFGQPTESLKNYNYQAVAGLGFGPVANFSAGLNVKYFRETLYEWYADGFGVDVGAHYDVPVAGLKFGLAVQNIGPDVKFRELEEPIPMSTRIGGVYSTSMLPETVGFSLALDYVIPKYEDSYIGAGAEVTVAGMLHLRGGYCGRKSRAGDGFTFGAGVDLGERIVVDYAATPYGDLGTQHMISVFFGIR